jgi:hypothetical protein
VEEEEEVEEEAQEWTIEERDGDVALGGIDDRPLTSTSTSNCTRGVIEAIDLGVLRNARCQSEECAGVSATTFLSSITFSFGVCRD